MSALGEAIAAILDIALQGAAGFADAKIPKRRRYVWLLLGTAVTVLAFVAFVLIVAVKAAS